MIGRQIHVGYGRTNYMDLAPVPRQYNTTIQQYTDHKSEYFPSSSATPITFDHIYDAARYVSPVTDFNKEAFQ